MRDFNNKTVVITGGATGIGFSFAKRFGEEGAKVVIGGLQPDRLQQAEAELVALGVNARHLFCDVTKYEDVEALADFAWKEFGEVHVILNNAGVILPPTPTIDASLEDARRLLDVNFYGIWHGVSVFGKRFIEQGKPAAIYNLGSENALCLAIPMSAAYVASKHAVLALTETLREDTPEFIDVGLICPGFVRSELGGPENEQVAALGMDTDRFTTIAMEQIKNGEFFIVSHAYNRVRIDARYEEIVNAFERYAPRYEGDSEFDVRTLAARLGGQ